MIREELPEGSAKPMVCTKFAALPYRLGPSAVVDALKASLDRLQLESVDAYMIHWPGVWQNDEYAEGEGSTRPTISPNSLSRRGFPFGMILTRAVLTKALAGLAIELCVETRYAANFDG